VTPCFIDTMRPVTAAEAAAWRFYLTLHRDHWKGARLAFRRVHVGTSATTAALGFVSDTGVTNVELLADLETALRALAEEGRR
jgi:hypothetical protein